jgi:hypothetical protein
MSSMQTKRSCRSIQPNCRSGFAATNPPPAVAMARHHIDRMMVRAYASANSAQHKILERTQALTEDRYLIKVSPLTLAAALRTL